MLRKFQLRINIVLQCFPPLFHARIHFTASLCNLTMLILLYSILLLFTDSQGHWKSQIIPKNWSQGFKRYSQNLPNALNSRWLEFNIQQAVAQRSIFPGATFLSGNCLLNWRENVCRNKWGKYLIEDYLCIWIGFADKKQTASGTDSSQKGFVQAIVLMSIYEIFLCFHTDVYRWLFEEILMDSE